MPHSSSSAIRSHLRLFTLAVLAGGLAWATPPARASFPGVNGKILFARFFSFPVGFQWFTVDPDGSGETLLLPLEAAGMGWFSGSAEWSADGSRIAFVAGEQQDAYTMNVDGTGLVNVTGFIINGPAHHVRAVTWAPNGTRLAYAEDPDDGTGGITIWTINTDGTAPTQITAVAGDNQPAWSPDGGTIAFIRNGAIWLMNPDGKGQIALPNGATGGPVGWSPDGTKLLFTDAVSGVGLELFVINRDGTGRTQLTNFAPGRYVNSRPQWSPEGTKIAFALSTQTFPSVTAIYSINPDGSGLAPMPVPGLDAWQPVPVGVSEFVTAGGTLTTDTDGDGATPADPIVTTVTTPNAGILTIAEMPASSPPPAGFQLLGWQVVITAPPASAATPLRIVFELDASILPPGVLEPQNAIQVFRNGTLVPPCSGAPGTAAPDPCVARRALLGGNVTLEILTSTASTWTFAQAPPPFTTVEVPVATTSLQEVGPAISKGKIAYTRFDAVGPNIYVFDLATPAAPPVPVTSTGGFTLSDIDGDYVVYTDTEGDDDVYSYNLATGVTTPVVTAPGIQQKPAISGTNVVWEDFRNSTIVPNADIYMGNVFGTADDGIVLGPATQMDPAISGSIVAWQDQAGLPNFEDIRAYNVGLGVALDVAVGPDRAFAPDVDGNRIVYAGGPGCPASCDIYLFTITGTGGTTQQLTTDPASQRNPKISGNLVVWEDDRNKTPALPGNVDLYGMDLSTMTEFALVTATSTQGLHDIDGNDIAFTDNRNGNFDIYALRLNRPPVAAAGPDRTVEAASPAGALVGLDGTGSSDPDGDPLTFIWSGPFGTLTGAIVDAPVPFGTYEIALTVDDGRGASASDTLTVTVQDTTPPLVTPPSALTVPATEPGGARGAASQALAAFLAGGSAADVVDASPTRLSPRAGGSNVDPTTLFPIGTTTVAFFFQDASGNVGTATSTVTVTARPTYDFRGFFWPVAHFPALNHVKAGWIVPLRFSLGGNRGLGIFPAGYPKVAEIACGSTDPVEGSGSAVGHLLYVRFLHQYIYLWRTDHRWAGTCRQIVVRLDDGTEHRANFRFQRSR